EPRADEVAPDLAAGSGSARRPAGDGPRVDALRGLLHGDKVAAAGRVGGPTGPGGARRLGVVGPSARRRGRLPWVAQTRSIGAQGEVHWQAKRDSISSWWPTGCPSTSRSVRAATSSGTARPAGWSRPSSPSCRRPTARGSAGP